MKEPTIQRLPASLLFRGLAFALDLAIVGALTLAIGINMSDTVLLALFLIFASAYEISFVAMMGSTPGKIALGIHVAQASGERLEPDKAILRWLIKLVSLIGFGMFISIPIILDKQQRRALHDRISRTAVLTGRPQFIEDQQQQ